MAKLPNKRRSAPRRAASPPVAPSAVAQAPVAKTKRSPRRTRSVADPPVLALLAPLPPTIISAEVNFAQFLEPKPKRARNTTAKTPRKSPIKRTKAKPAKGAVKRKVALPPSPAVALPAAAPAPGPAIALPLQHEPLVVTAAPSAMTALHVPLSRNRVPALYQTGGLLGLLSRWLDQSGRKVDQLLARRRKAKLNKSQPAPPPVIRPDPAPQPDELERLRAENEALKRQLEAALAIKAAISS